MGELFNLLIVTPSIELLKYLYGIFGSYGIAIIVFTIIIKILLLPLSLQQIRATKAMSALSPHLQALQKKYARDKEKLTQETMKLYKEAGVNPLGGCLPLLIQLPVLWGLYQAIMNLAQTPEFQAPFLWLADLSKPEPFPYILIIIMIVTQFAYQKMMTLPSTDPQQESMNRMMQFTPLLFAFFFINFPAGLVLYWVMTNLVSIIQQGFIGGWGPLLPQRVAVMADSQDEKTDARTRKRKKRRG